MTKSQMQDLLVLISSITFMILTGAVIGMVTNNDMTWYNSLEKSALTPPGWVFGVVWSILYAMIGVAAWCLWRNRGHPKSRQAIRLFALQLLLNWGWSFVFFTLHLKLIGFIWILVLAALVAWTIWALYPVTRLGAWLLVPYLCWVTFASYLAGSIWLLNP